jgi:predicted O-methyltransferase YrrM
VKAVGDALVSRAASRIRREIGSATEERSTTDLIVAAILAESNVLTLHDPVRFVELLRRSFMPMQYQVTSIRDDAAREQHAGQFQYFLDDLGRGVAPLSVPDAIRMATVADQLGASREPVYWIDVGTHFRRASSFARKARLLHAAIRRLRVESVIEIGTAYGMGTLSLASAVGDGGLVVTVEAAQPMARIGGSVVREHFPDRVRPIEGRSTEVVDQIADIRGQYDLWFHDAEHSREAYEQDFTAYEPLLAPGAIVIYDDIRWRRATELKVDPDPYGGWRSVTEHPRVVRAVEVDGDYGVLLLN